MKFGESSLFEKIIADGVYTVIETIPAADVAPVVRCKDCKYGEFVKRGSKYSCRKVEGLLNFCDFYCKDGVKKEKHMIHWLWALAAFILGGSLGTLIMAVIIGGSRGDE